MLKELFYLLIPDNIKNIEIYKKIIDIFIDHIEEKSSVSIDVNNIFRMSDEQYKLAFMQTYAKSFYEVLKTIKTSNLVGAQEFETGGTMYPSIALHKMMTPEQIHLIKKFGENKGSKVAIEFVNNLIESLNTAPLNFKRIPFEMETVDLFHYKAKGNLSKESFEKYVKPLAHPVGFIYDYEQGPDEVEVLKDTYKFRIKYNVAALTILYANDSKTYSYLENGYIVVDIKHEILPFLRYDFKGNYIIQNELLLRVTFDNGHYLDQRTRFDKTTVIEYNSSDEIIMDYSQENDNIYVNLEYIENDKFFPDSNILTSINENNPIESEQEIKDINQLSIYGEPGLIYTSAKANNLNWKDLYEFTYGFGTRHSQFETVSCDDYINIRNICRDSDLNFKIERE